MEGAHEAAVILGAGATAVLDATLTILRKKSDGGPVGAKQWQEERRIRSVQFARLLKDGAATDASAIRRVGTTGGRGPIRIFTFVWMRLLAATTRRLICLTTVVRIFLLAAFIGSAARSRQASTIVTPHGAGNDGRDEYCRNKPIEHNSIIRWHYRLSNLHVQALGARGQTIRQKLAVYDADRGPKFSQGI